MVDKFYTSLFQLFGGVGTSKIGMIITTEATNPSWIWVGRIALLIGLAASVVALLNGMKVLVENIKNTHLSMKNGTAIRGIVSFAHEVKERIKGETPKFFAGMAKLFAIVAIAALAGFLADKQVGLNISEGFRATLSYVIIGSLMGLMVCLMTVKDSKRLYKILEERTGVKIYEDEDTK